VDSWTDLFLIVVLVVSCLAEVCGDSVGEVPEEIINALKLLPCSEPDNKGQQNSWPR